MEGPPSRPAGFGSYARVRYLEEDRISERVLFARLRVHLAGRTKTPGDCFHGLWAGAVSGTLGDPARGILPWFPASCAVEAVTVAAAGGPRGHRIVRSARASAARHGLLHSARTCP